MQYFYAIVHKDADSSYGVTFPGLTGCFSAADTEDELLPNACEALELWFEDQPEAAPLRMDEVRALADESGGSVLVVPRITNDHRVVRANVSLERGILNAIDRAATERSLTRSAFIAQAARNEIERRR